jgi:hypothetical protein
LDLAHWLEYEKCQVLSFFSMSPNAVATTAALPTLMADREPVGTINELGKTNEQIRDLINSYDWNRPGLPGTGDAPDPSQFIDGPGPDSPLNGGKFDFGRSTQTISNECSADLTQLIGPGLAQGACFFFNTLRQTGLMPWIQFLIDLSAVLVLGLYLVKKWIDAGAS